MKDHITKYPVSLLLAFAVVLAAAPSVVAHGITKPQHGGLVQMSGEAFFELVQAPAGVSLYVLNEDEPVDARAMTAKLSISAAGRKTEVVMLAAEGHRFFARDLKLAKGTTVAVMVVDLVSKARLGATFTIP
jgi:hypothetical protein